MLNIVLKSSGLLVDLSMYVVHNEMFFFQVWQHEVITVSWSCAHRQPQLVSCSLLIWKMFQNLEVLNLEVSSLKVEVMSFFYRPSLKIHD